MKILLLEDDYALHVAVKETIELESHDVDSFYDGISAYDAINSNYKLFILDINVPNLNGIEVLARIKQINPKANVIMISANVDIDMLKIAYQNGCDDYIKKPFDIDELMLKISRLDINKNYKISDEYTYILDTKKLMFNGEEKHLTKKENNLLHLLISNENIIVTKEQISNYVYDGEIPLDASLRSLVRRVRTKLPQDCIETISGLGYKFSIN